MILDITPIELTRICLIAVGASFIYAGIVTIIILRKLYNFLELEDPTERERRHVLATQAALLNLPAKSIYLAVLIALSAGAWQLLVVNHATLTTPWFWFLGFSLVGVVQIITMAKYIAIKRLEKHLQQDSLYSH